jgi:UDP:flavonoid glycosyltransferase YjiC (YdhE family)
MHGHLFPALAILEELRDRGHEIAIRALSSEVAMLGGLGFDAAPLSPRVESLIVDDWQARTPMGAARRSTATFRQRAAIDGPDLSRAIREEQPDALLVDVAAWGALGAAEAWGGPWASFCPLPLPVPSRDIPPFGPGFPPARGLPGRLRDGLGWAFFERSFDRLVLSELNLVRSALGAAPLSHAHDLLTRPPLLLYMTTEAFDYPRSDWPANVVFVGPCAWDPPQELPTSLGSVTAPFVLVTTSTDFQNDSRLVRVALDALADQPCHLVATLPAASIRNLEPPPNATVAPFVPHGPILARASCAITHGGMGATQKALGAGVPVCAVPFGRDQFEVARRVEHAIAGTRLPPWRLGRDRLRRKVHEAIAMRPGAERVARSFTATGGARTAADAFDRLLRS